MDELTTVKRFYGLLASGDSAAALTLLHPDIEWTEAERTPYFAGTMRGVDAVVAGLFEPLAHDFQDFTTAPSDFLHDGSRVASFGRYSGMAKSTGRPVSAPFVHLWTVEDGRLRGFTQFTDSAAWNEALAINDQDTPALDPRTCRNQTRRNPQTLDQRHEQAKPD
jgi:uncharacterized protein